MLSVKSLFLSTLFISFVLSSHAQNEDFEEIILSETYHNLSLQTILDDLTKKYHIPFAYSSSKINLEKKVYIDFEDVTISEMLDRLSFSGAFSYRITSGKVVLVPAEKKFTVSGHVKDQNTGEILIGATVRIEGTATGTISNEFGYYSLTLPRGQYTLIFTYVGQEQVKKEISLNNNIDLDVNLDQASSLLDEVLVSPRDSMVRFETIRQNAVRLSAVEMTANTTPLGESDVIKSLNMLPGIQLFRDGSTFFNVRGGDRDQNQLLIDDAPVYNPAHFFGLYSSIIPEATKDVKIYKGDLPVRYGGRISSVIDVRTRDGNMKEPSTEGSIGLLSGKLMVEGPLQTNKSSFFISGRRSYIGEILRSSVEDLDQLYFYDLNAKINGIINENNRIYVSAFSGRDQISFDGQNGMSWGNTAGSIRWNHIVTKRLFVNTTLYASRYDYELSGEPDIRWVNHISNASLKSDFTFFINEKNTLRYGFRISGHNFNPGNLEDSAGNIPIGYEFVPKKNAIESSLYVGHNVTLNDHLSLNYGLRLSNWSNYGRTIEYEYTKDYELTDTLVINNRDKYNEYSTLEPRFSLSYNTGLSILKVNYTRSAQYINLISNSISPFNNLEVWMPASLNIKPQRSHQVSTGWHWLGKKWQFSAEAYYKLLENQIDYVNQAQLLLNPTIEGELRSGKGTVYGFEASISKNQGKLTGRISYAYSRSFRTIDDINDGDPYPTLWDRPHQMVAMINYSKTGRSVFSGSFYASSGASISTPTSYYEFMDRTVPFYGERNNSRLPSYYRFDVSASFRLNKDPKNPYQHHLKLSVFNFLNHKNAVFYNFNKIMKEDGDFIVPTNVLSDQPLEATQIYVYSFIPSITYTFKI